MNKQEQRAVKRYLHDIKRTLPVYRKMERRFLSDIHSTIEEYAEAGAVITTTTLKMEFGEPKEQVINYLTAKDGDTLQKELSTSAYIRSILVLLTLAIISLCFAGLCYEYNIYRMANESQIAYTETEIGELPYSDWEDGNPPGDAVLATEDTTETTNKTEGNYK